MTDASDSPDARSYSDSDAAGDKKQHNRRRTNMDLFIRMKSDSPNVDLLDGDLSDDEDEDDAPSPIPSPYVGPLRKGSRMRRQQERARTLQQRRRDEEAAAASSSPPLPSIQKMHQRSVSFHSILDGTHGIDELTPLVSDKDENASYFKDRKTFSGENGESFNDDDDDDDISNVQTILETMGESVQTAYRQVEEKIEEALADHEERRHYDWREFWKGGSFFTFFHWIITGLPSQPQTKDELQDHLNSVARMIALLREYNEQYGIPPQGGPMDQTYVLREVTRDLYAGGCPIWALQPVLHTAAEGLTGHRAVEFFMLPRRVFVFDEGSGGAGTTTMFSMTRGYDIRKLDDMEKIAVRLASFASNTSGSASVPARLAQPAQLRKAFQSEVLENNNETTNSSLDAEILDDGSKHDDADDDDDDEENQRPSTREEMATEILDLASEAEGLFFFLNAHRGTTVRGSQLANGASPAQLGAFWKVDESLRELFSHLACVEAMQSIDKMDAERKPLYSPWVITCFRVGASSGACAFWFNGSWIDMLVSGFLAVFIAWIGANPVLTSQERIIFEAVASFIVGLAAALVSLIWPSKCCFSAIAISGVLDLLQGFRVVYSIIELMSRNAVAGGADFMEGLFFTALIAYFLRFGQYAAVHIVGNPEDDQYLKCENGIDRTWYFFFVPLAAISWSGLFDPYKLDLPVMTAHGILGYIVSWQFYQGSLSQLNNFVAAATVTFSAGLLSRFTGRQALGNTVAGIYVLLPGAYLVDEVFRGRLDGFLSTIILRACLIGVGAWAGTVLCSPTVLGRSKTNSVAGPSLGAPVLTGPLFMQRSNSDVSMPSVSEASTSSARDDGRWTRKRRVRRNTQTSLIF